MTEGSDGRGRDDGRPPPRRAAAAPRRAEPWHDEPRPGPADPSGSSLGRHSGAHRVNGEPPAREPRRRRERPGHETEQGTEKLPGYRGRRARRDADDLATSFGATSFGATSFGTGSGPELPAAGSTARRAAGGRRRRAEPADPYDPGTVPSMPPASRARRREPVADEGAVAETVRARSVRARADAQRGDGRDVDSRHGDGRPSVGRPRPEYPDYRDLGDDDYAAAERAGRGAAGYRRSGTAEPGGYREDPGPGARAYETRYDARGGGRYGTHPTGGGSYGGDPGGGGSDGSESDGGGPYEGESHDGDAFSHRYSDPDGGEGWGEPYPPGSGDRRADADPGDQPPDRAAPRRTAAAPTGRRGARRTAPVSAVHRRRRLVVVVVAAVVLLGAIAGGGVYLFGSLFDPDYDGPGSGDVIVRVQAGDSTSQIGTMLTSRGVVASAGAFTHAARGNQRILAVQPGYYQMNGRMSAAAAVGKLVDPASRVGKLEIRGGTQLDDTRSPDGTTSPGVLSLISQASCGQIDGRRQCVSVDDLRAAMEQADPAQLGVPAWAVDGVTKADPARRFEGLVAPGLYDVEPGTSATDVWKALLAASVPILEATGVADAGAKTGVSPYQALIISSLVEKEAITPDMPKVARVVYNRLAAGQRLELDSTVNYPLDVQALRTTAEARAKVGPYNSYAVAGLPPTPIAAPGKAAMAAALAPEPGPWLFFVRCRPDGTSCFGTTLAEHQDNVRQAIANGAF
ncbi:hypothetical protein PSD17_31380 [Pseudonocardia sp. D17]|nr:hypothetical protein PSD17_31380 [Pseudonocardia sp. D17]